MPFFAESNLIIDFTGLSVTRASIELMNSVQEAVDGLKGDPFPLTVRFQLHDFLNCAIVSCTYLCVVVVILSQDIIDLCCVGTSLLLKSKLMCIASGRLMTSALCVMSIRNGNIVGDLRLINHDFLRHVLLHPRN